MSKKILAKIKVDKLTLKIEIPQEQEESIRKSTLTIDKVINNLREKYSFKNYSELLIMALIVISADLHLTEKKREEEINEIKDNLTKLLEI